MKPDLLTCWPRSCDYPLWREQLRENRWRFDKVIIVFTPTGQLPDFSQFIRDAMARDRVTFLDCRQIGPGEDWRNVATNQALENSSNKWVWFTEQDFFYSPEFWQEMSDEEFGYFAVLVGQRLHPCSILIRREILDKTLKDFSANPPKYDHFGRVQKDLEEMVPEPAYKLFLDNGKKVLGNYNGNGFYHFNGFSHNFRLITDGERANYNEKEFVEHLAKCLNCAVPIDDRWRDIAERGISAYSGA